MLYKVYNPFLCFDGSCVFKPSDCINASNPCPDASCWNGECVLSTDQCSPVPPCQGSTPYRCSDGSCSSSECTNPNPCTAGAYACPDGTCVSAAVSCLPYDGCGGDTPYQCPDGSCGVSATDCACSTNLFKCADGTCVSDSTLCPTPYAAAKPDRITMTLNTEADFFAEVWNIGQTQMLGSITIPKGSFLGAIENETYIKIDEVADSYLRNVTTGIATTTIASATFSVTTESSIVQPFAHNVTLCFVLSLPAGVQQTQLCLAYIDQTGKWNCQDLSLEFNGTSTFCGKTNHFTDYSVLFNDYQIAGSSSPVNSVSMNLIIGVAVGAVAGAALIIVGSVVVHRIRRKPQNRQELELMKHTGSDSLASMDLPRTSNDSLASIDLARNNEAESK